MTGEKVRLASMGLGQWARTLAAAARSGKVEIVRCFDPVEETCASFAEETGARPPASYEELLNDSEVEGVIVATPHSTHADVACEAASSGKHLFVEKPFALTAAEARRIIETAERAERTLQVGHKRRWFGANRRILEMIEAGELGMLHQLEGNYSRPIFQAPRAGWRGDPAESPLGGMTGLGIHMVDLLCAFAGGRIERLAAFSKKLFGKTNLDDVTAIALEFESGPLGYVGTSAVVPMFITSAALGTEAGAWSEQDGSRLFIQKKDEMVRREIPVDAGDGVAEELVHFAHYIRTGETPEAGGAEGLEIAAVLEAMAESVKTARAVEMKDFRE